MRPEYVVGCRRRRSQPVLPTPALEQLIAVFFWHLFLQPLARRSRPALGGWTRRRALCSHYRSLKVAATGCQRFVTARGCGDRALWLQWGRWRLAAHFSTHSYWTLLTFSLPFSLPFQRVSGLTRTMAWRSKSPARLRGAWAAERQCCQAFGGTPAAARLPLAAPTAACPSTCPISDSSSAARGFVVESVCTISVEGPGRRFFMICLARRFFVATDIWSAGDIFF